MSISDQIRQAMAKAGVSMNRLAKECGIPQPSLSRFLNGSELRSANLDKLAEHLGLEVVEKSALKSAPKKKAAPKRRK